MKTCSIVLSALLLGFSCAAHAAESDQEWNATPNDVNNLLKELKGMVDISYHMQIRSLGEISPDPEKNPVLYRSGHYNFEYSAGERVKLREFMLAGGMIIYNTGLGSAPFYRSIKKELALIMPEQPLQRLSSDHPIFHSYYDVDRVKYTQGVYKNTYYKGFRGNEPWFDGIEVNCRLVALVSRFGMAVGWEGEVQEDWQAYQPESAYRLGMNIFSYASAMRAWSKNTAHAMKFVNKDNTTTDKVAMVQVKYDGIWKTRHAGISVLLHTFNTKTEIPVRFDLSEMTLASPKVFNAPVLFLTGHENFRLKRDAAANLRQYLKNGGFLFAEACCGRKGFDLSFRELMKQVLPGEPLKAISQSHVLFRYPNQISAIGVTPTLQKELSKATVPPRLEGIEMDGVYAVIYSPLGMQGGWEMSQSPYARAYNDIGSINLGQNILMYAVTH